MNPLLVLDDFTGPTLKSREEPNSRQHSRGDPFGTLLNLQTEMLGIPSGPDVVQV